MGMLFKIRIRKYIFHFYLLILDFLLASKNPRVKFETLFDNMHMKGTVSQIFDKGPSFNFMSLFHS